jgi:hypothetical protein
VDWRIVGLLALGSLPATGLSLLLLSLLGAHSEALASVITAVLAIALMFTAVALIFRETLLRSFRARIAEASPRRTAVLTVAAGFFLGVLVSLSSVGAGALGVTALTFLYPRLPTLRIIGSDIAHAVPLTLLAGIGHWFFGTVDWHLLVSLVTGSVPGILIGVTLAKWLPEKLLRVSLAGILAIVATRFVFA